jgi:A/G-specific adenine glycosylase
MPEPLTYQPDALSHEEFRSLVWDEGRAHHRDMPWRYIDDPYAVLVSEVMLQQTQVARVVDRYAAWTEAFPTLDALAAAPLSEVLGLWQGLGYNRRGLNLKRAAGIASEQLAGALPPDERVLRSLPGVGPTTASAVLNYAFRIPSPFIETNVRAVFLHHFHADADGVSDRILTPDVEATWDREDPRGWGYALMDYGVHLKRTLPNPSRRSSHHTKQSRFEGSHRQKRAAVLRAVLAAPGGPAEAYALTLAYDAREVEELLRELAGEGFVAERGDRWEVPTG